MTIYTSKLQIIRPEEIKPLEFAPYRPIIAKGNDVLQQKLLRVKPFSLESKFTLVKASKFARLIKYFP